MNTTVTLFKNEPTGDLLYADDEITVTKSRIQVEMTSYVSNSIMSFHLHEDAQLPWRGWVGMGSIVLAMLVLLIYLYIGKISIVTYVLTYIVLIIVGLMVALYLVWEPKQYKLDLTLTDGKTVSILRRRKKQIYEIHEAIKKSVAHAHQDRRLTDPGNRDNPLAITTSTF